MQAARVSATAQQQAAQAEAGGAANGGGGAGSGKGKAAKEPTLAELLKAQQISLSDDTDPGLEDVREFFETVDDVARAETVLDREKKAKAAAANANASAAAATRAFEKPKPKMLDDADVEWQGEWS